MKVKFHSPVASITGSHSGTDLIYQNIGRHTYARHRTIPANPRSPAQQAIRAIIAESSRAWQTLTPAQRAAWEKYHETHYPDVRTIGVSMFNKASLNLRILGLPISHPAPVKPPPRAVSAIHLHTTSQPDTLTLTVTHRFGSLAGHALLIRTTPEMPTLSHKPRHCDFRFIDGPGPGSTVPLPASGQPFNVTLTRFPIQPGKRFGIEIQVVRTTDGIPSAALKADLIR